MGSSKGFLGRLFGSKGGCCGGVQIEEIPEDKDRDVSHDELDLKKTGTRDADKNTTDVEEA